MIFASSSSVYGNNEKIPFSETDNVDHPISPYAATKKAGELICHTHYHLYKMNVTCLRFFTVYGPRGRPDMAPYIFTKAILEDRPIQMFGDGETQRDYTYVSDIISGIISAMDLQGYHIINLGNNNSVKLKDFISTIEKHAGKKATIIKKPLPQGDVMITYADISKAKKILNYDPKVSIDDGLRMLVEWYKEKNNSNGHSKRM
jgi:UDP-glucuronate 4-epimerase